MLKSPPMPSDDGGVLHLSIVDGFPVAAHMTLTMSEQPRPGKPTIRLWQVAAYVGRARVLIQVSRSKRTALWRAYNGFYRSVQRTCRGN